MRRHTVQHHRHHTMNDRMDPNTSFDPGELHLQAQRLKREAERQSSATISKRNMLKIGALITLIGLTVAWMGQDKIPEQTPIIALMPNNSAPTASVVTTPTVASPSVPKPAPVATIPVTANQTQTLPPMAAIAPPAPKAVDIDKSAQGLLAVNEQAIQMASEGNPRQAINLLEKSLIDHKEAGPLFDNLRRLYAGFATQSYQMAMEPGKNKPITVELAKANGSVTIQIAPQDMRARVTASAPAATTSMPELPTSITLASSGLTAPAAPSVATNTTSAPVASEPPAPSGPPPLNANERKEASNAVMAVVKSWSDAWAKQDVAGYIAAYAPTYKPKDMSRLEWEAYRKDRLTKPKFIRLELTDLKAFLVSNTRMRVTFNQSYASETLKTKDKKTLELELINDQWRIISETGR
jgi:hypothetical protein